MDIKYALEPRRRAITCIITTTFSAHKMRLQNRKNGVEAIAHMVKKNEDPRLYLIEFWLDSLWPDPLIPEEMRLNGLMAFHETYQTISCSELKERVLMLDLHPLRGVRP